MDTMEIEINRWTMLGWEYSTGVENDDRGNWYIPQPDKPYYKGTYKQVCEAILQDRTFQSVKSGGTYYSRSWFVRHNNRWYRIIENEKWEYHDLFWDKKFKIDVESL